MKTKYVFIAIASLGFSTSGIAQSNPQSGSANKTSSVNAIASVQLKSGPLADFYELVAQHQLPNSTLAAEPTNPHLTKGVAPSKLVLELADNTKAALTNNP